MAEQYRHWKNKRTGTGYRHIHHIPLMREREILVLEELLSNLKPARCLEWGSGYSTLYFPQFAGPDVYWKAIEHNDEWADRVTGFNTNPNVEIISIPPNNEPWTDENNDGAYSDLVTYVDHPADSAPYDFILVDGRARFDCLQRAYNWVTDEGVVVLHDAMRSWYHPPLESFANHAMFAVARKTDQGL